jgi:membrane-bound lytic murein transglycosylase MltF
MDRNVFYEEVYKWDYAGIKPYAIDTDSSLKAYNTLLKKYGEQIGEDCKFRVYLCGDKCYYV